MVVISITVTVSTEQIVAGIPKTVALSTNVPSSIFYTLNGTTPTLFSTIYTSPIFLPTDQLSVILKILASNGSDTSPVITETYVTNMVEHARLAHAATTADAQESISSLYPFGTAPIQPNAQFLNPAEAGITVDNPALSEISSGFDGAGNPIGFTNEPYNLENYSVKYSTTNAQGETGPGIGNLPANVKVQTESAPPESSDQNSNLFDPRAFVIFQDASTENPNDPPHINRMHFSLENPEKARDGNHFFTSGLDAPSVSGTFLRAHHNPRTNTMTYYYLDTWTNKWIISTMPFNSNTAGAKNLAGPGMIAGGAGKVFEWIPFTRRVLF